MSQFPYKSYRPGQREAIDAARQAFARGKRFVVVEAPTGAGKSGIAVTLAREAKSAYVLTGQKILQDQYQRDFPDMAMVKGRANYPCLVVDTHAGAAPCLAGRKFTECEDCTYLIAKDEAMHANIATLNYAYFLAETNHQGGFGKRELLVLDEAHNAEEMLMRFVEVNISPSALARAGIALELPSHLKDQERFDFAIDLIPELSRGLTKLDRQIADMTDVPPDLAVQRNDLDTLISRLRMLRDSDTENTWVSEQADSGWGTGVNWWRFRPVRVAEFAEQFLFKNASRILMLSATILDAETFLRALGVEPKDASFIRVASSFPPENRPIKSLAVARLNRDTLNQELPKLTETIASLMRQHSEKGVIHAHSYRILEHLVTHLPPSQQDRLIFHSNASSREDALERHLNHKTGNNGGSVLLTPSMTEGIDLAEDLARWQIIIKVPYPYLGDPQVAARRALDPEWYEWRTALRMVQAYGRIVRSPTDKGTTYVLDSVFNSWVKRQYQRLPSWFLEAIV